MEREANNLGPRFKYMIELEEHRRRRNAKELIRMKKNFYLESNKEEIRANGIKRLKKLKDPAETAIKSLTQVTERSED